MDVRRLGLASAAIGLAATLLAGCGGGMRSALPEPPVTQAVPFASDANVPNVAGTYNGTFVETSGSHSLSGTAKIVVKQNGTALSGTWAFTAKGQTTKGPFSGTVRKTKFGGRIQFTFTNPKGRSASGKARYHNGHLNGKGTVPRTKTLPAETITVKTTRS